MAKLTRSEYAKLRSIALSPGSGAAGYISRREYLAAARSAGIKGRDADLAVQRNLTIERAISRDRTLSLGEKERVLFQIERQRVSSVNRGERLRSDQVPRRERSQPGRYIYTATVQATRADGTPVPHMQNIYLRYASRRRLTPETARRRLLRVADKAVATSRDVKRSDIKRSADIANFNEYRTVAKRAA